MGQKANGMKVLPALYVDTKDNTLSKETDSIKEMGNGKKAGVICYSTSLPSQTVDLSKGAIECLRI